MGFSAEIQMIRRNKTKIKEYNTIVTAKYIYIYLYIYIYQRNKNIKQ